MLRFRAALRSNAAWLGLLAAAVAVGAYVVLPIRTGQVGFDSAASVLYFERIAAGRHLEGFVTATPKPLLTLLYGSVHAVIHDWRAISWIAIVAFGVAAVLAARLALRIGGPSAAGFAATGFIGSSALVADVALAYALVWALIGWLIAGLALTGPRIRFGVAGLGLLLAGTARFESNILSLVAVAAVASWWVLARGGRAGQVSRRAWLIGLGLLALPIQWIHDWLLTGDPLFSLSVPIRGTPAGALMGPVERIVWLVQRYLDAGGLVFLAILGLGALILLRRWPILLGVVTLGPGIAAFLVYLEVRQIYVSSRYAGPIDLAVLFSAAVGFGFVVAPGIRALINRRATTDEPDSGSGIRPMVAAGLLAGALFASPFAATSTEIVGTARSNLTLHHNATDAEAAIATAIADRRDEISATTTPLILVPVLLQPQVVVDLGVPVTAVGSLSPAALNPAGGGLHPGQLIYHDRRGDGPDPAFGVFETTVPTSLGGVRIVPIASDPRLGWWVLRIEPGS